MTGGRTEPAQPGAAGDPVTPIGSARSAGHPVEARSVEPVRSRSRTRRERQLAEILALAVSGEHRLAAALAAEHLREFGP